MCLTERLGEQTHRADEEHGEEESENKTPNKTRTNFESIEVSSKVPTATISRDSLKLLYTGMNQDVGFLKAELVGAKVQEPKSWTAGKAKGADEASGFPEMEEKSSSNAIEHTDSRLCKTLSRGLNSVLSRRDDKVRS